ncbi:MAG: cellobiose phosphorylase [Lachnospiraceae bacterium]|nr:cellobiose phosphorylase [Lachnospiraceae bacterium]
MDNYRVNDSEFIIEDYDRKAPFSSFLPGLTGEDGIPMWAFYTNRGQALASLGINSKSEAIMEFNPACTEYENTALKGYRTFVKVNGTVYEPFRYRGDAKRTMTVRKNTLTIEEVSKDFGLKMTVDYFILPKEPVGAMARRVKLENISGGELKIEVLDGAAKIIPRGISNGQFQEMANLFKSWTDVKNGENLAPVFAMRASTADSAQVDEIKGGYYYVCTMNGKLMPFICDADRVFGYDTSLSYPVAFEERSLKDIPVNKPVVNKVPCAFTPVCTTLKDKAVLTWTSFLGFTPSEDLLNRAAKSFCSQGFASAKLTMANELAEELTADVRTDSAYPAFNKYVEQCYLDNFLRGGYPVTVGDAVLYLYSRKHGDPERDYNYFTIDGEYYSQGNGNFRDVCQNRRNDVFFCPGLKDYNVRYFASLIQLDGYNPLEIRPATFTVKKGKLDEAKKVLFEACASHDADAVLEGKFKPGAVFREISKKGLELKENPKTVVEKLLALCDEHIEAGALEGYWSDHWDYIMDLVDNYKAVYPDKMDELLSATGYRFYDSDMQVKERKRTYVLDGGRVWQYESMERVAAKAKEEGFVPGATNWKRNSDGSFVEVTLFAKLFVLALVKFATIDSYGMGVEMEGGKPGWNDAMNGLPAMFAGSMPETFELKRLLEFLVGYSKEQDVVVPAEVASFFETVAKLVEKYPLPLDLKTELSGNEGNWDFEYWNAVATAREDYRKKIYKPLGGNMTAVSGKRILKFLKAALLRVDSGIEKAKELSEGGIPTYFTYEPTSYEILDTCDERGRKNVKINGFRALTLPQFLEGPARYLAAGAEDAAKVHKNVLAGGLYDKKLKMFKTSESIEHLSLSYGRVRAFTPGWLERESIFLHMEYKYLYALLKNGLYDEFYKAIKTAMIPFMDPEVYGRSTLENSSFIASSANPDERVHGRGFVARLSGSTVELISMWINMFLGERAFYTEDGELKLTLAPALPSDFFAENGTAAWTFMGQTRVVYHNKERRSTYGKNAAKVVSMKLLTTQGETVEVKGDTIGGELAKDLRNGRFVRIDAKMK